MVYFVSKLEYTVVVEPMTAEDGGGFVATVPDLPGCMSDGEMHAYGVPHSRTSAQSLEER